MNNESYNIHNSFLMQLSNNIKKDICNLQISHCNSLNNLFWFLAVEIIKMFPSVSLFGIEILFFFLFSCPQVTLVTKLLSLTQQLWSRLLTNKLNPKGIYSYLRWEQVSTSHMITALKDPMWNRYTCACMYMNACMLFYLDCAKAWNLY